MCFSSEQCYGKCNEEKGLCDRSLVRCMADVCVGVTDADSIAEKCVRLAQLRANGNKMKQVTKGQALFSCPMYREAQNLACMCVKDDL